MGRDDYFKDNSDSLPFVLDLGSNKRLVTGSYLRPVKEEEEGKEWMKGREGERREEGEE